MPSQKENLLFWNLVRSCDKGLHSAQLLPESAAFLHRLSGTQPEESYVPMGGLTWLSRDARSGHSANNSSPVVTSRC